MIKKIFEFVKGKFHLEAGDELERIHIQYLLVCGTLCIVSLVMTVMNFATGWYLLGVITSSFFITSVICVIMERFVRNRTIGRTILAGGTLLMFTFFLIIGDPEGFSALWILILPACGMLLFGLEKGVMLSLIQLVIIIYLLWTPNGRTYLQFEYTDSFLERFPIIYGAFLVVGVLLEYLRKDATEKLNHSKLQYEYMYNHDVLTGLLNRYGFNSTLDKFVENRKGEAFSFGIFDLDKFKNVNDTYGHLNGDIVLQNLALMAKTHFGDRAIVCRWGGEEFSLLIFDTKDPIKDCEALLQKARTTPVELNGEKVIETFSLGLCLVKEGQEIETDQLVKVADSNLYDAKRAGRNRVLATEYSDEKIETV